MADAISTNDDMPISIVIETNDTTITVVPAERVQKQLRDIAAAGIDMQLVTNWITAKYINSIQPVHELIASDVRDLWLIRTDEDVVRILQLEIEQCKSTRKSYRNAYIAPVFPTERHHRHEDFLSPGLQEAHQQLVDYLGVALFRYRTPEEIAEEILRDSTALGEAMSEAADQIVSDGEALGDAMSQRAKTLASEAFAVSPTLPIEDHLAVPKVSAPVPTEGNELPRVHGEETEVEIPSIYGGMYVEQQPRSRAIGDLERRRGLSRSRRPMKDGE